jgi:signal transduction histidine kinase
MRTFSQGHRCRTLLLIVDLFLAALTTASSVWAADRQKQVFVLYSTRRDAQIAIVGGRELPRILDHALPEGVDYYSEYIEQPRFPDSAHQTPFRDFLRLKYAQQQFDVVIAIDDLATEFIETFRNDLFPATPVVFFANSPRGERLPNATGVVAHLDYGGSLQLAVTLQPDLRRVFVVMGADTGPNEPNLLKDARAQFQSFANRLMIEYLTALPAKDLERRLATLPDHSIVYYLSVSQDGAGQNFHPLEYLDRLASVANAPIYCWVDSAMDHGIVGGSLKNQANEMRAVGELALRVLRGERADTIPPTSPDLSVSQVDWRQLRRWGISEARVPAGTLVRFREPSVWDRYRIYILGALTILLAQTALITGLLVQKSRRRQAEEQLRGREAELRTSYERIRQLAGRLLNAQETERSRIARELHDDILQKLAVLTMELTLSEGAAPEKLINETQDRVRELTLSVRDLSHQLHPARLRLIGLIAALHGLQEEVSRPDITITFAHDNVPTTLLPDLTLCLFRIAQESLQNALKYSGARHVTLELRGGSDRLALTIGDDGVGFDVNTAWGKGLGLLSMAERLEAFSGTLKIRSSPGAGTRVEVTVPLPVVQNPETVAV